MRLRTALLLVCALTLLFAGCNSSTRGVKRAIRLEREDKPAQALEVYQELLQQTQPDQTHFVSQLYLHIGECLWKLERTTEAFAAFQQAVQAEGSNIMARLRLSELYLAGGSMQHAVENAQAVLAQEPDNAEALSVVGAAQQSTGDIVGATRTYVAALRADPGRVTIAIALADIYAREDGAPEARIVLRRAADAARDDAAPLLALGRLEEEQGNIPAAEEYYKAAVRREDTPNTNLRLAQFLERSARVSEAERVLRRSDDLRPSQPTSLADFEMISGRAFRALRHYADLLQAQSSTRNLIPAAAAMSRAARAGTAARLIEADLESPYGTSTEPAKSAPTSTARARQHLEEFRRDLDAVTAEVLEAEIALAENDLAVATTRAAAAVSVSPHSSCAHYVLGVAKFRAGDLAAANSEWHTAVDRDSNFIPARLAVAQQEFAAGDAEAAEEEVVPVVREEPGNIRALVLYARTLATRQRFDAAEVIARRAVAVTEANPEPHIVLGEIALERDQTANALSEYEQAVIMAPASQEAIEGLINVYRRGKVTREMLQSMESLGQQPPHSATILEIVGRIYADRGWYDDAMRALKASLSAEPHRATAALALARVYTEQGSLSAAEDSALLIGDHTSALLAAVRAQQNHDVDSAIRQYESAVREGEETGVAANNLAWIYAERGERLQRALALAESARNKAPQNAAFLDTLGFVQLQRREYTAAVETLKKAVQLAVHDGDIGPALPQIVAHLAEARRLAGETGEESSKDD